MKRGILFVKLIFFFVMKKDDKINGNTFIPIGIEAAYMTLSMYVLFHYRNELHSTPTGFLVSISIIKTTNLCIYRHTFELEIYFCCCALFTVFDIIDNIIVSAHTHANTEFVQLWR